MKSTGVIRKIDDLGRIVIPKEIRKNLRIKTSDNVEIFIDNEDIILKKYSMMNKISDLAQELTDAIYTFMKHSIFITDSDYVVAGSGPLKKDYVTKHISEDIEGAISRRESMIQNHIKEFNFIDNNTIMCSYVNCPILTDGEVVGMIYIIDKEEKLGESEMQLANIVSSFVTKYLEQ